MAVTILETIKSAANAGNTAYIVILSLLCDTYSDLPTQYSLTGYELAQGCKAHVIDTNTDYMLDSSGNWHISGGEIWQNVYTKTETDTLLAGKQDTLTTAQLDAVNSGVTAAKVQQYDNTVTDEAEDRAALVELVDAGNKNLFNPTSGVQSVGGFTITPNGDGTYTVEGERTSTTTVWIPLGSISLTGNYFLSGAASNSCRITATVDGIAQYDYGSGVELNGVISNNVYINIPTSILSLSGVIVKPMICTKAAWDISHKFVPYCPSMQEMYQMILALQ